MLNEPFQILDNIPLMWCFASFETYQSRVLEIVTQKRGLTDAPKPTRQAFPVLPVLAGLQCVSTLSSILFSPPADLRVRIPAPRHRNRVAVGFAGEE